MLEHSTILQLERPLVMNVKLEDIQLLEHPHVLNVSLDFTLLLVVQFLVQAVRLGNSHLLGVVSHAQVVQLGNSPRLKVLFVTIVQLAPKRWVLKRQFVRPFQQDILLPQLVILLKHVLLVIILMIQVALRTVWLVLQALILHHQLLLLVALQLLVIMCLDGDIRLNCLVMVEIILIKLVLWNVNLVHQALGLL
jgi:hypothetical protein